MTDKKTEDKKKCWCGKQKDETEIECLRCEKIRSDTEFENYCPTDKGFE